MSGKPLSEEATFKLSRNLSAKLISTHLIRTGLLTQKLHEHEHEMTIYYRREERPTRFHSQEPNSRRQRQPKRHWWCPVTRQALPQNLQNSGDNTERKSSSHAPHPWLRTSHRISQELDGSERTKKPRLNPNQEAQTTPKGCETLKNRRIIASSWFHVPSISW